MKENIFIALIDKIVDEKINNIKQPLRGKKGDSGRPFVFSDHVEEIRSQINDSLEKIKPELVLKFSSLSKDEKEELGLKFSDLTPEEKEQLKGQKGKDGTNGRSFSFEENKQDIELIISAYIESVKEDLKIKFSDLTPENVESLKGCAGPRGQKGKRGERGEDGKGFHFKDHKQSITEIIYNHIADEKESLKLKFSDLSPEDKEQLKLKFSDLLSEDIEKLRGPKGANGRVGRKGEQGNDGINGDSSYDIWLKEGNTGSKRDFLRSLEGLPGMTGPIGRVGKDGLDGRDGRDAREIIDVEIIQRNDFIEFIFIFNDGSEVVTNKISLPEINSYISNTLISTSGSGGGSSSGLTSLFPVLENISATKLISARGYLADKDSIDDFRGFGVAVNYIALGEEGIVQTDGIFSDASFSFTPNQLLFLGNNGEITHTVPTTGKRVKVGTALTSTSFKLELQSNIITIA